MFVNLIVIGYKNLMIVIRRIRVLFLLFGV